MQGQAERLRRRGVFAGVGAAFLRNKPDPAAALAALSGRVVYLMPLFMSEGWLAREALAQARAASGPRPLVPCAPLGLAAGLTAVIADVAEAACRSVGRAARQTSLVLVGHGASDDPASRQATQAQAARVAGLGRFAAVEIALIEEPPSLDQSFERIAGDAVVVGFFASGGRHADADVPAALDAIRARRGGAVLYTGAIGAAPEIIDVILNAVRRTAAAATSSGG